MKKEMDMLEDKIIDLLVGIKKGFIQIFGKKKNALIAKQL